MTRSARGLSDPIDHVPTLEERAADLGAVMDACGFGGATITALFDASLVAFMFAAQNPTRVDGLVLWNPFAQGWRSGPLEELVGGEDASEVVAYDRAWEDVHQRWGKGESLRMQMPALATQSNLRLWSVLERAAASPGMVRTLNEATFAADVRALLPLIPARVLGDARWRQVLGEHERVVRAEVGAVGGRVIQMIGDGSLRTFEGPAQALRCGERIIGGARELDLEIRAGLHTGECEMLWGDIAGLAVHIAARVSAKAGAGEVLVSRTVRDLVTGSGIVLQPKGTHALKGVPGTWELFAVGEQTGPLPPPDQHRELRLADRAALLVAKRAPVLLRAASRLRLAGSHDQS